MKSILLCLHGWGGSKESFTELREALQGSDIEILTPDLPGFGDEPEPDHPWKVDDYAEWTEKWLNNQKPETRNRVKRHVPPRGFTSQKLYLLGHSHGGRIAIKLITRENLKVEHLFLCAAAGIKRPRHLKRILGLTLAKTGKFFLSIPGLRKLQPMGMKLLYKLVRVHDYEKASPLMRQTLIEVTKEDLRPLLPKITLPTDIFWGEDDRMTTIKDGREMHEAIRGSEFYTFPSVRHRVHRDRADKIAGVIRERIGGGAS